MPGRPNAASLCGTLIRQCITMPPKLDRSRLAKLSSPRLLASNASTSRLPLAKIVGSDIAHAVPLTLVAGIGHWMLGSVDWRIFGSLLMGSLPGILLGSYLSARVAELALRIVLAVTLTTAGGKLAFEQIQNHLSTLLVSHTQ
jgi:hypothetical protein